MGKGRVTRWFVEPMDAGTNESAMMDLVRSCGATEDMIYYRKPDNEGVLHDVVEVNHPFVARMECNAVKFQHRFRVFTQAGNGVMRLWPFGNQRKLSNTAEAVRIAKELAQHKATAKT